MENSLPYAPPLSPAPNIPPSPLAARPPNARAETASSRSAPVASALVRASRERCGLVHSAAGRPRLTEAPRAQTMFRAVSTRRLQRAVRPAGPGGGGRPAGVGVGEGHRLPLT